MRFKVKGRLIDSNWAWKIMRSRPDKGDNLFSEFETYGHYMKNHHSEQVAFVERRWLRAGTQRVGGGIPSSQELQKLAGEFDFVAFERASTGWRRLAGRVRDQFRGAMRSSAQFPA